MKIPSNFKNLFNDTNKTNLIGLLTILLVIWSILYIIPNFFVSLFDTILGNLILLIIILLVGIKDYKYGIILGIIIVILYRFSHLSKKEGFGWTPDSTKKFIEYQYTTNPHIIFDTAEIQKQSSQEELDYFLKNGMWPWSPEVKKLYEASVITNPYIRTGAKDSTNTARTVYNQASILKILSWETKEGQFLLKGLSIHDGSVNPKEDLPSGWGDYGYKSGLISPMKNIIQCGTDQSGKNILQKIEFTGKDPLSGVQTKKITPVDYKNLKNIIPGFSFINAPCNPCIALNNPPDYSCQFKLNISGNDTPDIAATNVSSIWKYLWNVKESTTTSEVIAKFPLLNKLRTDLNNFFTNSVD